MSNPRDDEQREFESWVRSTGIALHLARENDAYIDPDAWKAWHSWLARAERVETPIDIPFGDAPCGHPGQYCWTEDGGKHVVCLLCEFKKAAAAPVEDHPAPAPPYPDHECAGCNLSKELMVGKHSSIVGHGAIHPPEGWLCMKWLEPEAYAAYVRMERIKSQLAGAPEKE